MMAAITTASASAALLGGGLGLAAAAVLGYLLYRGTYRLNLRAFFNVTSILLLLFAAGLLAHGLHEFHEAWWGGPTSARPPSGSCARRRRASADPAPRRAAPCRLPRDVPPCSRTGLTRRPPPGYPQRQFASLAI